MIGGVYFCVVTAPKFGVGWKSGNRFNAGFAGKNIEFDDLYYALKTYFLYPYPLTDTGYGIRVSDGYLYPQDPAKHLKINNFHVFCLKYAFSRNCQESWHVTTFFEMEGPSAS